jgi:hypothetical protein
MIRGCAVEFFILQPAGFLASVVAGYYFAINTENISLQIKSQWKNMGY